MGEPENEGVKVESQLLNRAHTGRWESVRFLIPLHRAKHGKSYVPRRSVGRGGCHRM